LISREAVCLLISPKGAGLRRQMLLDAVTNDFAQMKDGFVSNAVIDRVAFLPSRDQSCVLQRFQMLADIGV
jgi:polysaccharide pyruvyl transferase WcaK-like protein